jgi:hypothetical protein
VEGLGGTKASRTRTTHIAAVCCTALLGDVAAAGLASTVLAAAGQSCPVTLAGSGVRTPAADNKQQTAVLIWHMIYLIYEGFVLSDTQAKF